MGKAKAKPGVKKASVPPPATSIRSMFRSREEIDEVLNKAAEAVDAGTSNVPGESYEAGVEAGIRWLIGDTNDHPIPDE